MTRFQGQDLACIRGERGVFAGLGFDLAPGAAIVLRGANGSGKTSLLKLMAGLLPPARGALTWDQTDLVADPRAHHGHMHLIGHDDAVKPVLTVRESLTFWARIYGGADIDRRAVRLALARFGIEPLADLACRFLSAGQRRRATLARLVAAPAPLWLLDEPTTALDDQAVAALEAVMADHRAGGGMIVAASHGEIGLRNCRDLWLDEHPWVSDGTADPLDFAEPAI